MVITNAQGRFSSYITDHVRAMRYMMCNIPTNNISLRTCYARIVRAPDEQTGENLMAKRIVGDQKYPPHIKRPWIITPNCITVFRTDCDSRNVQLGHEDISKNSALFPHHINAARCQSSCIARCAINKWAVTVRCDVIHGATGQITLQRPASPQQA